VKYTKEFLQTAVTDSLSVAGVLRLLGAKHAGGSHAHITRKIKQFGIDTSHFLGKGSNRGTGHRGGNKKKTPSEWFVLGKETDCRVHGRLLKRALLESGVPELCAQCGQLPIWNGKPLVLSPDHENGKFWDNRKENLKLLCPNCHSQSSTFAGRNRR